MIKEFSIMADFNKSYLELLLCLTAQKLEKLKGGKQKKQKVKMLFFIGRNKSGGVRVRRCPWAEISWL